MSKPRDEYLCSTNISGQSRLSILNAANHKHIKALIEKLDLRRDMNVLDVACGTGEITCQLAEKNPLLKVIGIDFSEEQIATARKNAEDKQLKNVEFMVMSAYDIKNLAEKYQFDRIFIRWVLGHLKYPQQVIESCKSLLKPHGMILCEEGDIKTHHCESANPTSLLTYGLFVLKIENLQKKRGVNARIGKDLQDMFRQVFKDDATIESERHQLTLTDDVQKEAVTTSYLNEVGPRFVEEGMMSPEALHELQADLEGIAHDKEAKILYTEDVSVVVRLK